MHLPANQILPIRRMTAQDASPVLQGHAVAIVNDDKVARAIASGSLVNHFWGVPLADMGTSGSGLVQFAGLITVPSGFQVGSWGYGDLVYLDDATLGYYRNTPPTTVGKFIVPIGRVIAVPGDALVTIEKGEIVEIT